LDFRVAFCAVLLRLEQRAGGRLTGGGRGSSRARSRGFRKGLGPGFRGRVGTPVTHWSGLWGNECYKNAAPVPTTGLQRSSCWKGMSGRCVPSLLYLGCKV
jgi:hypothetical protein